MWNSFLGIPSVMPLALLWNYCCNFFVYPYKKHLEADSEVPLENSYKFWSKISEEVLLAIPLGNPSAIHFEIYKLIDLGIPSTILSAYP